MLMTLRILTNVNHLDNQKHLCRELLLGCTKPMDSTASNGPGRQYLNPSTSLPLSWFVHFCFQLWQLHRECCERRHSELSPGDRYRVSLSSPVNEWKTVLLFGGNAILSTTYFGNLFDLIMINIVSKKKKTSRFQMGWHPVDNRWGPGPCLAQVSNTLPMKNINIFVQSILHMINNCNTGTTLTPRNGRLFLHRQIAFAKHKYGGVIMMEKSWKCKRDCS